MSARTFQRELDAALGEWTGASTTPAGTTQATAAGLFPPGLTVGPGLRLATISGASNAGVILPVAVPGTVIWIKNISANTNKIYPSSGGQINALGADAALSLATVTSVLLICTAGNVGTGTVPQWHTLLSA